MSRWPQSGSESRPSGATGSVTIACARQLVSSPKEDAEALGRDALDDRHILLIATSDQMAASTTSSIEIPAPADMPNFVVVLLVVTPLVPSLQAVGGDMERMVERVMIVTFLAQLGHLVHSPPRGDPSSKSLSGRRPRV